DDPQMIDAVTLVFAQQWQDCTVVGATDSNTGLQHFYEQDPDIVVLSVSIPGRNGFDVLQDIRRMSDIPVIMLTAQAREIEEIRALQLGADDYVVKPTNPLVLLARVRALLRRAEL